MSWWMWYLAIGVVLGCYAHGGQAKRVPHYKNLLLIAKVAAFLLVVFGWPFFILLGVFLQLKGTKQP